MSALLDRLTCLWYSHQWVVGRHRIAFLGEQIVCERCGRLAPRPEKFDESRHLDG